MTFQVEDHIDHGIVTPEHILWLAVIERAMMDYIDPCCRMSKVEINALESFFFSKEPSPYNLAYICLNLLDYPNAHKAICKRVRRFKMLGPNSFERAKRYRRSN